MYWISCRPLWWHPLGIDRWYTFRNTINSRSSWNWASQSEDLPQSASICFNLSPSASLFLAFLS